MRGTRQKTMSLGIGLWVMMMLPLWCSQTEVAAQDSSASDAERLEKLEETTQRVSDSIDAVGAKQNLILLADSIDTYLQRSDDPVVPPVLLAAFSQQLATFAHQPGLRVTQQDRQLALMIDDTEHDSQHCDAPGCPGHGNPSDHCSVGTCSSPPCPGHAASGDACPPAEPTFGECMRRVQRMSDLDWSALMILQMLSFCL